MAKIVGTNDDDRLNDGYEVSNDILRGLDGDDVLRSGYGDDKLFGGAGNDEINVTWRRADSGRLGGDTLSGGDGDDTLEAEGGATIFGGAGNDIIELDEEDMMKVSYDFTTSKNVSERISTYSDNEVDAGDGDDVVVTGIGRDVVEGGDGFDLLVAYPLGQGPYYSTASYDRVEQTVQYGRFTADLQTGQYEYSGDSGSLKLIDDYIDFTTKLPETRVIFDESYSGYGSFSMLATGFEGVIAGQAKTIKLSGTDRTDVTEFFGRGTTPSNMTVTGVIDGRGGDDVVTYASATWGVKVDLAAGRATGIRRDFEDGSFGNDFTDQLRGIEGAYGSIGDDVLRGDDGDNILGGRRGDDLIDGRGGNDTVAFSSGVPGNLRYHSSVGLLRDGGSAVVVDLEAGTATDDWGGTDTLISIENVIGTVGDDVITGTKQSNRLEGLDGNDTLDGGPAGRNILDGGAGDDILTGGRKLDRILGGEGNDTIAGGAGGDVIFGGEGADDIKGGKGNDIIRGERAAGVENSGDDVISGGAGKDEIKGFDGDDKIFGDNGNDILDGGEGDDILDGGNGDDLLLPGKGLDIYRGGDGFDTLDLTKAKGKTEVDLAGGDFDGGGYGKNVIRSVEEVFGGSGKDVFSGSVSDEELHGGDNNDRLSGGGGDDTLSGGRGNDKLFGEGGDDFLFGDDGRGKQGKDVLEGGAGDDELKGGGGNDKLDGGRDDDVLDGGKGNDRLVGGSGSDTFIFSKGKDVIIDFELGLRGDTMDFTTGPVTFSSYAELTAAHYMKGGDLIIAKGGAQVTLKDVNWTDFTEVNFETLGDL
ncbi:hypothetical protein NBRC116599_41250 [Aquicoccus sp. SU-CL01552]